jgi:hypothetical protein
VRDAGVAVPPGNPCPAGSSLRALTPDAGHAFYGTVFGPAAFDDLSAGYVPGKIEVQVTLDGGPLRGCEVRWETAAHHGWVFADDPLTDAQGKVRAYWTAGDVAAPSATAAIALPGGERASAVIKGAAAPGRETRGDSVHFTSYVAKPYSEYKVRVTPVTAPESTYYETHGFKGAYAGIQFDGDASKVIFSTWDANGQSALLKDSGACNETVSFGGEGTGVGCRLRFPPRAAIAGLPADYALKAGDTYELHLVITQPSDCGGACTDYAMTFSDITRGFGPISLGTQRYMQRVQNDYNDIFIEDWWSVDGDTCINAQARTAYFHDMQAKIDGAWVPVRSGRFSPNFVPSNNEICANYAATVEGARFLLSSGGSERVGPPLFHASKTLTLP